jgi:hypothetical protein
MTGNTSNGPTQAIYITKEHNQPTEGQPFIQLDGLCIFSVFQL